MLAVSKSFVTGARQYTMNINVEYINPFIQASQQVLKQVANIDFKLGKVYLKDPTYKVEQVVVIIGMTGNIKGQVNFCMSLDAAKNIASKMMGGYPVTEFDDLAKSAIGELANMIMGNTSMLFSQKGLKVEITPPSILMGENMILSTSKMINICVPLLLDNGDKIDMDVAFVEY
ncbi:chemotaxis protein CheX [Caldicellulosiruptor naganoensis]|uniref:Chemotaxis protein CheX n=2 Tax=Caldicellulosiruptor naganoensis TaxID=29324 RepID=A0ABY7BI14_9FIRM|nr:chemotaxis protein CheX [Caldicellulosiruptor naganoensis]